MLFSICWPGQELDLWRRVSQLSIKAVDSGLLLGAGYKWATGIEKLQSKLGNSFVELPCTRWNLSCKDLRVYAQTTCNPENQGFCFQLCTEADSVGFLPLPWSKTYQKSAIERDWPGSSCYSSRFSKSREDRILRGRQLSSILVQQNIYHHMIREDRTVDTVLVKSREMTDRTQSMPRSVWGKGVKTTENKIHWIRWVNKLQYPPSHHMLFNEPTWEKFRVVFWLQFFVIYIILKKPLTWITEGEEEILSKV